MNKTSTVGEDHQNSSSSRIASFVGVVSFNTGSATVCLRGEWADILVTVASPTATSPVSIVSDNRQAILSGYETRLDRMIDVLPLIVELPL